MWRINKNGKEQIWYEKELIDKIKAECKDYDRDCIKECGFAQRILDLIQENAE